MPSGVYGQTKTTHELENILAAITRIQDHLRVAATKNANRRVMTLDDADLQYEIDCARGDLTELTRLLAKFHPNGDG